MIYVIAGTLLLGVLALFLTQRGMIYHPRPYDEAYYAERAPHVETLRFELGGSGGPMQQCYYKPQAEGESADFIWVVFVGNASGALNWFNFANEHPDRRAGWLLIEYPGYGRSAGKPTEKSIAAASDGAWEALMRHLGTAGADWRGRYGLLGQSLGTATALQFACRRETPPTHIVMISPFTKLLDMARRTVGWPLNHLVIDRFDNEARLREAAQWSPRPKAVIVHGDADEIVPHAQGRRLAEAQPWIKLVTVVGGDHIEIVDTARDEIWDAMDRGGID